MTMTDCFCGHASALLMQTANDVSGMSDSTANEALIGCLREVDLNNLGI